MKIIYSGGWNNESQQSIKNSFIFTYADVIQKMSTAGRKIAFVTLAKPDGYYDALLMSVYNDIEIINTQSPHPEWSTYDGLFIPGGDTEILKTRLLDLKFSLTVLKDTALLLGDSAGGKVLTSYFFKSPRGEKRGEEINFIEGLNPEAEFIVVPHTNNPDYCNEILISNVEAFAKKIGIRVLKLAENEQKLYHDRQFLDIDKNQLQ